MKKIYMTPEMEILDAEIEGGILAASEKTDPGSQNSDDFARQGGFGFDDFDDFEDDEY